MIPAGCAGGLQVQGQLGSSSETLSLKHTITFHPAPNLSVYPVGVNMSSSLTDTVKNKMPVMSL